MNFRQSSTVAIIGAGPYGLSVAAHLRAARTDIRIFGSPMHRWQHQMPKGMYLKSEGRASSLSDPAREHTLERYCLKNGLPYSDKASPVSLETFLAYAMFFQRELVPNVENVMVRRVEQTEGGFRLLLADGSVATAAKVIVATGLDYAVNMPSEFRSLPPKLVSHSADLTDLSRFRGKTVVVIGAGQSALEGAALLSEAGAEVTVLVRQPALAWNDSPQPGRRPLGARIRHPDSNLGEGLSLWAYCTFPSMFRYLPLPVRLGKVRTELGPAGAWWLKERVLGRVKVLFESSVIHAEEQNGRASLQVKGSGGKVARLTADHVMAATGYRFALNRVAFLSGALRRQILTEREFPVLSPGFESSVAGLYFTGIASVNFFGPAMRFIAGTGHTARSVARHVTQSLHNPAETSVEFAGSPAATSWK